MQLNISFEPVAETLDGREEFKVLVCSRHLGNLWKESVQVDYVYEEISYLSAVQYNVGAILEDAINEVITMYQVSGPTRKTQGKLK